jgi:hypothetical protein
VVVADVSAVRVVVDVRPETPRNHERLLRRREVWEDPLVIERLDPRVDPPVDLSAHVVDVRAEPIEIGWNGKVCDVLPAAVVPRGPSGTPKERRFVVPGEHLTWCEISQMCGWCVFSDRL